MREAERALEYNIALFDVAAVNSQNRWPEHESAPERQRRLRSPIGAREAVTA